MSPPSLPPGQRWRHLAFAVAISAASLALLVFFNWQYLFHTPLYENGDLSLNSISVLRAERFHEIYGAFSRWDLHHPGPALFYLFAWAEEVFHQALHWVPTPYNAQVLGSMLLCSGFFGGSICVAARWVRSGYFLPLALLFGTLHYVAVRPQLCLMNTWPPFTMPMIFLALVLAAASTGAGQGDDLPLLILAGGFAVHSHLAQPLFVLPLFTLGYLGLATACFRAAKAERVPAVPAAGPAAGRISPWPWRRFPRAHAFAACLLFAFLLPLFADLCKGSQSNLVLIVKNLPRDHSKHHPWLACVYYFLRFGTYRPSLPGAEYFFSGHASAAEIGRFCLTHLRMGFLWLAALLLPAAALALRRRPAGVSAPSAYPAQAEPHADAGATATTIIAGREGDRTRGPAVERRRWRFLGWLFACWLVSAGLTVYWAHLLEVEMAYYHAWFAYSVWFVLAIIAAAALSDLLEGCAARTGKSRVWLAAVGLLCSSAAAWTIVHHRERFHDTDFLDPVASALGRVTRDALAEQTGGSRTKILTFPTLGGGAASGVAALLERWGYDSRVEPQARNFFGRNHAPPDLLDGLPWKPDSSAAFDVWRIVPAASHPAAASARPLPDGYALVLTHPEADPNAGTEITFTGGHPNYNDFVVVGWSQGLEDVPFVWSEGNLGMICFRPKAVPADKSVEVIFDSFPLLLKGVRDVQRVDVGINDYQLGTWHLDEGVPTRAPRVLIPGAVWNKLPLGMMTLRFSDPLSPADLHPGDDPRRFALGTRKITFHVVDPPAMP